LMAIGYFSRYLAWEILLRITNKSREMTNRVSLGTFEANNK
jgi:hypothetical protein